LQDKTGDVHGIGLLTRFEPARVTRHDSSVPGREPRGILEVELEAESGILRILVTHFGLRAAERRHQSRMLVERAQAGHGTPTLVLGDINEWRPRARSLNRLREGLGDPPAPRSFPASFPVLRLDRIWMVADSSADVAAHRSPLARLASDHLPVVARLRRDLVARA
jgi:endonuclease/exonuclease/phosphatase family metal-dependent hydrolase